MTENNRSRFEKIARFSEAVKIRPPHKLPPLNKKGRELLDKLTERAKLLAVAQTMNGTGQYSDQKFRQMILEYNNRALLGRGDQQPSSFQVMQDFVAPDDRALILKISPEKFHSIDSQYILNKITSNSDQNASVNYDHLDEGLIYHISIPDGLDGLKVSGSDSAVLYGMSFVRRGSEVSIFSLFGRFGDKSDLGNFLVDREMSHPDKGFLFPESGMIRASRDDFFNIEKAYPVILLLKIDLERSSSVVRFVLTENKDTFDVSTDSREMFTEMSVGAMALGSDRTSEVFERSFQELSEYKDAFAIISAIPGILRDIEENDDLKIVRIPTEIKTESAKTSVRKIKKSPTRRGANVCGGQRD